MHKETVKKAAYGLGKLLGILGLVFVLYTLSQQYTLESFSEKFSSLLPLLPLLFLLNFLSILLGIYAWHMMLQNYASGTFAFVYSYYYFAKTEISKYLPGNVFHFVGRQALASKIGITQMEMAKISVLFSFLLLTATVVASTFFALFATGIPLYILLLMLLGTAAVFGAVYLTYRSFPLAKKIRMNLLLSLSVALQGIMLGTIVLYQTGHFDAGLFFQCISIYTISWLIGFVTPGASGGIGVREGAFIAIVAFLHSHIASEIIIFSVLLVRLINILVDMVLFASTFIVESKIEHSKKH